MQSFEIDKTDVLKLKQALEGNEEELIKLLGEYHASEIAILFSKIPLES